MLLGADYGRQEARLGYLHLEAGGLADLNGRRCFEVLCSASAVSDKGSYIHRKERMVVGLIELSFTL